MNKEIKDMVLDTAEAVEELMEQWEASLDTIETSFNLLPWHQKIFRKRAVKKAIKEWRESIVLLIPFTLKPVELATQYDDPKNFLKRVLALVELNTYNAAAAAEAMIIKLGKFSKPIKGA